MGYDFHILRPPSDSEEHCTPIPVQEWRAAVDSTVGVRFVRMNTGDPTVEAVEVFFREAPGHGIDGTWMSCIYWSEGAAVYKGQALKTTADGQIDITDPVWVASSTIAHKLGAVIQGEDGERYDLHTGKVIGSDQGSGPFTKRGGSPATGLGGNVLASGRIIGALLLLIGICYTFYAVQHRPLNANALRTALPLIWALLCIGFGLKWLLGK